MLKKIKAFFLRIWKKLFKKEKKEDTDPEFYIKTQTNDFYGKIDAVFDACECMFCNKTILKLDSSRVDCVKLDSAERWADYCTRNHHVNCVLDSNNLKVYEIYKKDYRTSYVPKRDGYLIEFNFPFSGILKKYKEKKERKYCFACCINHVYRIVSYITRTAKNLESLAEAALDSTPQFEKKLKINITTKELLLRGAGSTMYSYIMDKSSREKKFLDDLLGWKSRKESFVNLKKTP